MGIVKGDFVRYIANNELCLVGKVEDDNLRCWCHMGGTRALMKSNQVELLKIGEAMGSEFTNEHAKSSLAERALRLNEGKDVTDLIDEYDIRRDLILMLKKIK